MNLRNIISTLLLIPISILFYFGCISYKGELVFYIAFSIVSNAALFYCFRKNSFFFDNFFSLLLWLGFWFKFSVQISFMESMFPEGTGTFDFRPMSFDEVLIISSIGIMALITASFIREKIYFHKKKDYNFEKFLNFYTRNRKLLIFGFILVVLIFALVNLIFVFYQKGSIPMIILPLKLNNLFGWLLTFGFASFSSLIIYAELILNKKKFSGAIIVGFIEVFVSSISILSRAMIFNGFSLLLGYFRSKEILNLKIDFKIFIKYLIILLCLFFISLIVVSKIRQSKDFHIGHEIHSYIPNINIPNMEKNYANKLILKETNNFIKDVNQILFLIAGRWVGIEGVMSVYPVENKSFNFFKSSLIEKFNFDNSFYENKIKKNNHIYDEVSKTYTVFTPGLFAFLYYTGSKIFLFLGVILLCLIASFFEYCACKVSRNNFIFSSLIGNIIAYRLAHFGYIPANSYKIILALLTTILIVYLIMNCLNTSNKSNK